MSAMPTWFKFLRDKKALIALGIIALLVYPLLASSFFTFQVGAYSLILGIIGLSLMVLAGYGGMVSLAQLTVAGIASYFVAILGDSSVESSLGWPWWVVVPCAVLIGTVCGTLIGVLAVRTVGLHTIMITLAISVCFFYFVRQNYTIFNGFTGFAEVKAPVIGGVSLIAPIPFYYLSLAIAGICLYFVSHFSTTPSGLALQAIRDNPRRMEALGFNVKAHRIAAYFLAGLIAAMAGVLLVWFNARISPGTVGVDMSLDILIIAVLGGLGHPIGPFLGALAFVLLENFAIDLIDRERFNTVIGVTFLLVLFLSPDGIIGLWRHCLKQLARLRPS